MSEIDPVAAQLDALALLLETNGYALEVNYTGATITVWTEAWPIQVKAKVKRQKAKENSDSGGHAEYSDGAAES